MTKNSYFLTFNPLLAFTDEVRVWIEEHCDSYLGVKEHLKSNIHCHICVHGVPYKTHKAMNDAIKKKYPHLKNPVLVIKAITSETVYNYIAKEYTEGTNHDKFIKDRVFAYEEEIPDSDYWCHLHQSYKIHKDSKSLSSKFNIYWFTNQHLYNEISFNFSLVLCFRSFCKEFKVKDCTHRTFQRMKQYLFLQLYPNLWLEQMCEKEDIMADFITHGIEYNHIKPKKPTKMDIHMEEVFGSKNPDFNTELL